MGKTGQAKNANTVYNSTQVGWMWVKQSFCKGADKREEEASSPLVGETNSPGLWGMTRCFTKSNGCGKLKCCCGDAVRCTSMQWSGDGKRNLGGSQGRDSLVGPRDKCAWGLVPPESLFPSGGGVFWLYCHLRRKCFWALLWLISPNIALEYAKFLSFLFSKTLLYVTVQHFVVVSFQHLPELCTGCIRWAFQQLGSASWWCDDFAADCKVNIWLQILYFGVWIF